MESFSNLILIILLAMSLGPACSSNRRASAAAETRTAEIGKNISHDTASRGTGFDMTTDISANHGSVEFYLTEQNFDSIPQTVTLKVVNNSPDVIQFGASYTIEKLENGFWNAMEFSEPMAFIAIMYHISPGGSEDYVIGLFPENTEYRPGLYRVVKTIWVGDETRHFEAPFTIS